MVAVSILILTHLHFLASLQRSSKDKASLLYRVLHYQSGLAGCIDQVLGLQRKNYNIEMLSIQMWLSVAIKLFGAKQG